MRVATWNIRWCGPRSRHFVAVRDRITSFEADLLILTETTLEAVPPNGHVLDGGDDWGYAAPANRRKVVLWSRWPIRRLEQAPVSPSGRHAGARIDTPEGDITVHAVCVPWSHAHVSSGRGDRRPWDDHVAFLRGLDEALRMARSPVIVAGDMNQRGGEAFRGPRRARDRWLELCAGHGLNVVTDDFIIDKIALGPGLVASGPWTLEPAGLSDHHAVGAVVERNA